MAGGTQQEARHIMIKSVLTASAMLVVLCSAASAHDAMKHQHMASATAIQVSEAHRNSFAFAPTEEPVADAHQYHGGPKVND
jgi:opacity protein-like surface antigen